MYLKKLHKKNLKLKKSFLNDFINNSVYNSSIFNRLKESICSAQSDWTKDSNPIRIVEFYNLIKNIFKHTKCLHK